MTSCYKNFLLVTLIISSSFTTPAKAENEALKVLGAVVLGGVGWVTAGWLGNKITEWDDSNALYTAKSSIDISQKYSRELSFIALTGEENNAIQTANKLLTAHSFPKTITDIAEQIATTNKNLRTAKTILQQKVITWQHNLKTLEKQEQAEQLLATIDMHIDYMSDLDHHFAKNKANLILYKQKEALASKNNVFLTMLNNNSFSYSFTHSAQAHVQKYSYAKDWIYLSCAELVKEDYKTLCQQLKAYGLNSSWQSYQEACLLRTQLDMLYTMIVGSREYQDQLTAKKLYELQKRQAEAAERAARAAEEQARTARQQLYATQEQNRIKQDANTMLRDLLCELDIRKQSYKLTYYPITIQQLIDSFRYEIARDCNQAEINRLQRELNRALNQRDMWY